MRRIRLIVSASSKHAFSVISDTSIWGLISHFSTFRYWHFADIFGHRWLVICAPLENVINKIVIANRFEMGIWCYHPLPTRSTSTPQFTLHRTIICEKRNEMDGGEKSMLVVKFAHILPHSWRASSKFFILHFPLFFNFLFFVLWVCGPCAIDFIRFRRQWTYFKALLCDCALVAVFTFHFNWSVLIVHTQPQTHDMLPKLGISIEFDSVVCATDHEVDARKFIMYFGVPYVHIEMLLFF